MRLKPLSLKARQDYAKRNEIDEQKRRFAALEGSNVELCDPCRTREPWVDICPECFAKVERGTK